MRKITETANLKSHSMIMNTKKAQLEKIFDKMDHDNDGEISSGAIDVR